MYLTHTSFQRNIRKWQNARLVHSMLVWKAKDKLKLNCYLSTVSVIYTQNVYTTGNSQGYIN